MINYIGEFELLFDLKGRDLQNRNKWEIGFTDGEGDIMLVGDIPWQ